MFPSTAQCTEFDTKPKSVKRKVMFYVIGTQNSRLVKKVHYGRKITRYAGKSR
jgi:hypothetical protein